MEKVNNNNNNSSSSSSSSKEKMQKEPIEMDFLIIDDKLGVKEELIKEDIWNMRLEAWKDREGKEKVNSWLVEKGEFAKKNLFQNKTLNSAITGEKNKMMLLKIQEDDENVKDTIRKLQSINITETMLADKKIAEEYKGYEVWLLEKNKLTSSLLEKINIKSLNSTPIIDEKKWPDDYYKVEEIKKHLSRLFNPEDKEEGDEYGYKLLLQGALVLKFRESVKNIWDYLGEINLENMEEKDLEGIKRTLIMIFHLFDAKCMKESRKKELIYYCFSHIVRNCKKCTTKEVRKYED